MKILYVDISLNGHREVYLNELVNSNDNCIAFLPEKSKNIFCDQIIDDSQFCEKRSLINYIRWISKIKKIVKKEKIDIVHFLCGDSLYRFFGIYLKTINKPIVVTYHHMLFGCIRNISIRNIFKNTTCGVVHTEFLMSEVNKLGILNVRKIEYPIFNKSISMSKSEARKYFNLPEKEKILLVLGSLHRYKGIDILLEALKYVKNPFFLFIAGSASDFDEEFVIKHIAPYSDRVKLHIKYLSDLEFSIATIASDIIVLPYRREFDGASGPMIEGVWYRKFILGSSHGSMGNIINKYSIGKTFETENVQALSSVLDETLNEKLIWKNEAEEFRDFLEVKSFINSYKTIYSI